MSVISSRGFGPALVRPNVQKPVSHASNMVAGPSPGVAFLEIKDPDHNGTVRSLLSKTGGIPQQDVQFIGVTGGLRGKPENAEQYVVYNVADVYNEVSSKLEKMAQDPSNKVRVLNVAFSNSGLANSRPFFNRYNSDPAFQADVRARAGISENATLQEQTDAVFKYMKNTIETNPEIQAARARYENATRAAKEKGINVVVAAGNGQDKVDQSRKEGAQVPENWAFNFLAQSDHVISVGAIDGKGSKNTADDTAAAFSAKGDNRFRPTVAINGVNVQGKDGTSFAASQVSGIVARMLKVNPNLTVDQVKSILQSTASNNPNIDSKVQGAGLVQPDKAIQAAAAN